MSPLQQLNALYDQDILLWSEETVAQLQRREFENLDLEHLIEEIEALGVSQKKELTSRLIVLLEHLLKRLYVNLPNDYNGWERTIRTQRGELEVLFDAAPSLRRRWEASFAQAWRIALKNTRKEYPATAFPSEWGDDRAIESILNKDFWLELPEESLG
ncbi:MAG: DUF29 family protein [Cyanobacteria bacterium RI_101]|nr:DUF29 family protein [Cyanobacteria bacterium RI_101]